MRYHGCSAEENTQVNKRWRKVRGCIRCDIGECTRVKAQDEEKAMLAVTTLTWVCHAELPL